MRFFQLFKVFLCLSVNLLYGQMLAHSERLDVTKRIKLMNEFNETYG